MKKLTSPIKNTYKSCRYTPPWWSFIIKRGVYLLDTSIAPTSQTTLSHFCKLAFTALVYLNTPYLRLSRHKSKVLCSAACCFIKKHTKTSKALIECIYIPTNQSPTPSFTKSHLINYLFQKPSINKGGFCDFYVSDENSPSFFKKMLAIRCTATSSSEPNMQSNYVTYTPPYLLLLNHWPTDSDSFATSLDITGGML